MTLTTTLTAIVLTAPMFAANGTASFEVKEHGWDENRYSISCPAESIFATGELSEGDVLDISVDAIPSASGEFRVQDITVL